jgi:hypothetical protein
VTAPRAWKARFLDALSKLGNVRAAAEIAGVDRSTAYRARSARGKAAERFCAAWDEALEEAYDRLEQEAWRRAIVGTQRPVFHKGEPVGTVTEYSDRLLELLLRAHRPGKYELRQRLEHSGPGGGPIAIDEPRDELAQKLLDMAERLEARAEEEGARDE